MQLLSVHCVYSTFLLGFTTIAGVVILNTQLLPLEWRIEGTTVVFPLLWLACGHVMFPFLLNVSRVCFEGCMADG